MREIKIETASKITDGIMFPLEMLYCMVCVILITMPIYVSLQFVFFIKDFLKESKSITIEFFTGPQDEKPGLDGRIKVEDHVLDNGGAFTEFCRVSKFNEGRRINAPSPNFKKSIIF